MQIRFLRFLDDFYEQNNPAPGVVLPIKQWWTINGDSLHLAGRMREAISNICPKHTQASLFGHLGTR